MKTLFPLLVFIFLSFPVFSQQLLWDGYVVTEKNDTVSGSFKTVKRNPSRIKIYNNGKKIVFPRKEVKCFFVNGNLYVKSEYALFYSGFFKKEYSGAVGLYKTKGAKHLGKYDSDVNLGGLKTSARLFFSDYPELSKVLDTLNKNNVDSFLVEYDRWKSANPSSKSFYEKTLHEKNILNFKLSFLTPFVGLELGVRNNISWNSSVGTGIRINSSGIQFNPFLKSEVRYYFDQLKRKEKNQRTYKYSGNFAALCYTANIPDLSSGISKGILSLEGGGQRMHGKHYYSGFHTGVGFGLSDRNYYLLWMFELGYNF